MGNQEREISVCYNLAGSVGQTEFPSDFQRLLKDVEAAGFDSVSAHPYRGLIRSVNRDILEASNLTVAYLEVSFNPVNTRILSKYIFTALACGAVGLSRRLLGDKSEPPIFQDAFFAPKYEGVVLDDWFIRTFPKIKIVGYDIRYAVPKYQDNFLIGLSPSLKTSVSQLRDIAEMSNCGIVFDPTHLISTESVSLPNQPVTPKDPALKQLEYLGEQVEVLDFKPFKEKKSGQPGQLEEFLKGQKGLLYDLVALAKSQPRMKCVRVEISEPLKAHIPLLHWGRLRGMDEIVAMIKSV